LETYLTGMLGQRLGLRPPLLSRLQQQLKSPLAQTLDLLLATEDLHVETMRRTMSGPRAASIADQPIPEDIAWAPPSVPLAAEVPVEPMAGHVPVECFYLRFGSFENYLWLEDLLTSYGGDIGRMVTARGQDARLNDRVRRQLSLPNSALAKLFGGQLIADVAIIGRDMYLQEGAAVGVLFHARNTAALATALQQHRRSAAAAEAALGGTVERVAMAGGEATLLSTPDNQLRSFHVVDGDFHLVTTSQRIAERFLEAGRGVGALSDSAEFRLARTQLPLSRGDTVFAFLSTSFFGGLMGPQYQIELQRRMQAATDMELVQLARLAATAEGANGESIESMVAGGFLPRGCGNGVDGSGIILEERRAIDSLRGGRGTFLPIPDVPVPAATAGEVAAYNQRARYFAEQWRQLDPLMVAVKRIVEPGKPFERLSIDANISPIAEEKYGWILSLVGPPVTRRVAPREGDIASLQAHVTGGQRASLPPHLLFFGVQDVAPAFDGGTSGWWQTLRLLRTTPGYLGAWPKPGFLDWLPIQFPPAPDGFSQLPLGLWRWQGDGFSVLSFHRDVLDTAVPQLRIEDTDQPAQVRLNIGDLSASRLRDWINWLYFQRARETSAANVQLLDALNQQLRVHPDESLKVAESLLNATLICPQGGKYERLTTSAGRATWHSTAWSSGADGAVPEGYRSPLLEWFRGLDVALTKSGSQVLMHADVLMQGNQKKPALFDLLR
jgi:hypothetical protein